MFSLNEDISQDHEVMPAVSSVHFWIIYGIIMGVYEWRGLQFTEDVRTSYWLWTASFLDNSQRLPLSSYFESGFLFESGFIILLGAVNVMEVISSISNIP